MREVITTENQDQVKNQETKVLRTFSTAHPRAGSGDFALQFFHEAFSAPCLDQHLDPDTRRLCEVKR